MAKGQKVKKQQETAEPLPDPPSPSASASESSDGEEDDLGGSHIASGSRPATPLEVLELDDSVTCMWDDCGQVFTHMPTLIDHIHNHHIGVHKSNYSCEWTTCPRKGIAQTSRFALVSHIRSHTGEKPFICSLPECDKSFTRSDALAKHMRLQHNILPPAPGRASTKKRKRGADDDTSTPNASAVPSPGPSAASFTTFKIDPRAGVDTNDEHADTNSSTSGANAKKTRSSTNGGPKRQTRQSQLQSEVQGPESSTPSAASPAPTNGAEPHATNGEAPADDGYASSSSDSLPPSIQSQVDNITGLIMGQTKAKAQYLLMKAKHGYALEQNKKLQDELQLARLDAEREKVEKENLLDEVFHRTLGPEAVLLTELENSGAPPESRHHHRDRHRPYHSHHSHHNHHHHHQQHTVPMQNGSHARS